jgi:hypothetical protein
MDPFKAVELKLKPTFPAPEGAEAGPEYLQAFGLALRGL